MAFRPSLNASRHFTSVLEKETDVILKKVDTPVAKAFTFPLEKTVSDSDRKSGTREATGCVGNCSFFPDTADFS